MKNLRGALHGIRFQDRAGATPAPARFRREKARELALGPKDRPSRQMEIAAYPNLPRSDLTPECAGRTTSPRSPVPFIGIVAHINGRPIGAAAPPAPAPSHHSSSAQRSAGLICRPRLNRDPRDLAGLAESEKFPQILEGTDIGALDGHHLQREQHGRDRARSAVKPDHYELAAFSQDVDTELHGLG